MTQIEKLKQQINIRDLIFHMSGQQKTNQHLIQCPACQNGGKPIMMADNKTGKAVCYWQPCESREFGKYASHDIISITRFYYELSFTQALEFLEDFSRGNIEEWEEKQ